MDRATRDGIVSQRCDGQLPFWEVWSHRLEGEAPGAREGAEPVLLIHAATLARDMFLVRGGGFVKALLNVRRDGRPRFDVLTLDWRSSKRLFGDFGEKAKGRATPSAYRLDDVVGDVQNGVRVAAGRHGGAPVHVVAHCIGAAAAAQAIATRAVAPRALGNVVLSTVALFYRVNLDGVLKTAENVMDAFEAQGIEALSPYVGTDGAAAQDWPPTFKDMYEMWLETIFPHGCGIELCNRLCFMYGGNYRSNEMEDIHGSPELLREQFGAMPVGLYRHVIDNCRRGWAAAWDGADPRQMLDPEPFRGLGLTLITGNDNQVWHRDSIDRMHEWLRRELGSDARQVRKRVFEDYGHVDLWWSRRANEPGQVFPYVIEALQRPAVS
ncbi:MAG TPA: alpha/beta fold hydrolase [Polyangia bacterium]|nr:alpha/beta fold hydrolase [Polyangia bacterium]